MTAIEKCREYCESHGYEILEETDREVKVMDLGCGVRIIPLFFFEG